MDDRFESALPTIHALDSNEIEVSLNSPAIRRLIEEVRAEENGVPRSYNRTFNRHNR